MRSRLFGQSVSVRTRIVWTTAAVTVVAMALMVLAVVLVVAHLTADRIDASLTDRLAATESVTRARGDGSLQVTNTGAYEVLDTVWVFDSGGVQVAGPAAGAEVRRVVGSLSRVARTTRVHRGGRVYLAQPFRVGGQGGPAGVAVASALVEPYEGTRDILIGGLTVLGILVTALTAAITAWSVRRTLRPVQQMTGLAAEWSEKDLDTRFDLGGRDDEFTRLGDTLDGLLDRVAHAIRNEQQLTAELAHELRTPLTTIRAEAELGLMTDAEPAMAERLERVVAQVDRLNGTISTLLALARHQHRRTHRAELTAVVARLVEARRGGVPFELDLEPPGQDAGPDRPIVVAADADLVERVVGPVLDNALRYAATAVGVRARRAGRDVVLQVRDDGPGIESGRPDVFLTGVGDPAGGGAGLGLPLSRRVAASLGGSVEVLSHRDPTIVQITLPAA